MKTPSIQIKDHGPYQIRGAFELIDATGKEYEVGSDISLCRCGRSENKPFCDGTHKEIDFESAPRVEEDVMIEV